MCCNINISIFLYLAFAACITNSADGSQLESPGRFLNFRYLRGVIPSNRFMEYLLGNETASDTVSCALACFQRRGCITNIFRVSKRKCYSLKTYFGPLDEYSPKTEEDKHTKMTVASAVNPCQPSPCHKDATCKEIKSGYQCICPHNRTGVFCDNQVYGRSCLDIMEKYANLTLESGVYRIASSNGSATFAAYCDMKFGTGGWTRVLNVVADTTDKSLLNSEFIFYDLLGDIKSLNNFALKNSALQQFRQMSNFTEIRFKCKSSSANTIIHIQSDDKAVIDYMSTGDSSIRPTACGTFTRLIDDSSSLATNCNKWRDAKWGYHKNTAKALAYHTFYIPLQRHWNLLNGRFECDGIKDAAISVGDFWEVYVK